MNPIKNTKQILKTDFLSRINDFGLKINIDSICKYVDSHGANQVFYNIHSPKVFTIDFVDKNGDSWASAYGYFYKEHTSKKTQLFKDFKEFTESHTFKIGSYYFIS